MQMQQKNLSQQLKHVQGMLTTCEKNVATLGSKFSRKIQVVKMLKESRDYVKSPPKSPYKKMRSARADSSLEGFDGLRDLEMEIANAARSVEGSLMANAVAVENGVEEKAEELKISVDVAPKEDQINPVGAGNEI